MQMNLFRAFFLYPLCIALLPLLVVPFIEVSADLQKGMLVALALGAALVWAGVAMAWLPQRSAVSIPPLAYVGWLVAAVAFVSAILNERWGMLLFGLGGEIGTFASFVFFAAAIMLGALLNRTDARRVLVTFVLAVPATAVVVTLAFFVGWSGGTSLVPSWPQLALLLGAALVLAVAYADAQQGNRRFLWSAGACAIFIVKLFFFHQTAAFTAGVVLLALFFFRSLLLLRRPRRWPFLPLLLGLALMALYASGFRALLTLPADVRPTQEVTRVVGSPVYTGALPQALLGSGPDTFAIAWERYRPATLNQTPFWMTTFREGYSTVFTWLVTLGTLGVVSFFLSGVALLYGIGKVAWRGKVEVLTQDLLAGFLSLAAYLFGASLLYTIELPLFLMSALGIGICIRILSQETPAVVEPGLHLRVGYALVLCSAGSLLLVVSLLQIVAAAQHARGVAAFQAQNIERADALLSSASALWPTSLYLRDASRAVLDNARQSSQASLTEADVLAGLERARLLAVSARNKDSKDFASWLSEGTVLATIMVTRESDLIHETKDRLRRAQELAPVRPEPLFLQALVARATGDQPLALQYVQESLRLKSDYVPAQELLRSLQEPLVPAATTP